MLYVLGGLYFIITGVTGILCSRFCQKVVLTDHNEEVLKVRIENHVCRANRRISLVIQLYWLIWYLLSDSEEKYRAAFSSWEQLSYLSRLEQKLSNKIDDWMYKIFYLIVHICRIVCWEARLGERQSHQCNFTKSSRRIWLHSWSWHLYP